LLRRRTQPRPRRARPNQPQPPVHDDPAHQPGSLATGLAASILYPDPQNNTEQALKRFMNWLTSHERQVAAGVCLFAGAFMVITGSLRTLS
jgi:hypothetical protein